MRARTALLACAVGLAPARAAAVECRQVRVGGALTATRVEESPGTAVGGRAMLQAGCLAASLGLDVALREPRAQVGFEHAFLAGLGGAVDLHPRVSVYGLAVTGNYGYLLTDYISGKWRGTSYFASSTSQWNWAWGGAAGIAVRVLTSRSGDFSFPVLGVTVTGLWVRSGSDRLRGVSWGGWQPMVTASLGAEFGTPLRRSAPAGPQAGAPGTPGLHASPELHAAAAQGRTQEVLALLARGADPNAPDADRATPLHHACSPASNDATVQVLLSRGADVRAVDASGATPLHWAAASHRPGAVRLLLEAGAGVDVGAGHKRFTALHAAAAAGDLEAVELLLGRGAAVNVRDAYGLTPLASAEAAGRADVAERLRRAGAAR